MSFFLANFNDFPAEFRFFKFWSVAKPDSLRLIREISLDSKWVISRLILFWAGVSRIVWPVLSVSDADSANIDEVSKGEVCELTKALPTYTEVILEGEVGELCIFCGNLLNFLSAVTTLVITV